MFLVSIVFCSCIISVRILVRPIIGRLLYSWKIGPDKLLTKPGSAFIRKGEVGNWKQYFSDEQSKLFDDMFSEKLGDSGLTFQFE